MAESKQRKIAEPIDLDDEDPFAELTRIMGFDPRPSVVREPVAAANTAKPVVVTPIVPKAAQPAPVPAQPEATTWQPAPTAFHDDFAIDLEKELLGGFSDFDLPADPAPAATAAPVVATSVQTQVDEAFDHAFADIGDLDLREGELIGGADAAVDHDAFEHAAAGDLAQLAGSAALPEPVLSDDAFDDAIAAELGAYEEQPVVGDAAGPIGDADALDHAAAGYLGTYAEQPAVSGPASVEPAYEPAEPLDAAVPAEIGGYAAESGHDDLTLDFDLDDLYAAQAVHTEAIDAPVEEATAEETYVDDPIDPLADVDMDFAAAFDRQFVPDEQDGHAGSAQPVPAAALARLPAAAVKPADDHFELSLEDELNALLENDHAGQQAAAVAAPVAALPAAFPAASHATGPAVGRSQVDSDWRWAALEADGEDESVDDAPMSARAGAGTPEARRPFGDPMLTSRHANFRLPTAPALSPQPPAEDLDALLDAMEHEVHGADEKPANETLPAQPVATSQMEDGYAYQADGSAAPAYEDDAEEVAEEPAFAGAPDIETVDVPEASVPLADEFDIPELAYEEDERQTAAYDDIDADFAANFNETATSEEPVN